MVANINIIKTIYDDKYTITKYYSILARQSNGAFIPKTIITTHKYKIIDLIDNQLVLIHEGSSSDGQLSEPQHTFIDMEDLRVTDSVMYEWAKGFTKATDK